MHHGKIKIRIHTVYLYIIQRFTLCIFLSIYLLVDFIVSLNASQPLVVAGVVFKPRLRKLCRNSNVLCACGNGKYILVSIQISFEIFGLSEAPNAGGKTPCLPSLSTVQPLLIMRALLRSSAKPHSWDSPPERKDGAYDRERLTQGAEGP